MACREIDGEWWACRISSSFIHKSLRQQAVGLEEAPGAAHRVVEGPRGVGPALGVLVGDDYQVLVRMGGAGLPGVEIVRGVPGIGGGGPGELVRQGAGAVGAQGLDRDGFFLYCISIVFELSGDEVVGLVQGAAVGAGPGVVEFAEGEGIGGEVEEVADQAVLVELGDEGGDGIHERFLGEEDGKQSRLPTQMLKCFTGRRSYCRPPGSLLLLH
jgi:hypothetical protein